MLFLIFACDVEPDRYVYGDRLSGLELDLYTVDVGVHPDQSILDDPDNPFRSGLVGESKWEVLEDGPVAGFYAWASVLARIPTGEHQYYTALQAHQAYDLDLVAPKDQVFVRSIAIRGYQVVLDEFPDAVTFDPTGRFSFPLAPAAYDGIEALGGDVQGGWVRIDNGDGSASVVKVD